MIRKKINIFLYRNVRNRKSRVPGDMDKKIGYINEACPWVSRLKNMSIFIYCIVRSPPPPQKKVTLTGDIGKKMLVVLP